MLNLFDKSLGDGNLKWLVITAPALEPITVTEVKTYCRIDGSDEDTMLGTYITAVRQAAELYTGRAFITQTIKAVLDYWPGNIVRLPRSPLIAISSVNTIDESGTATAYSSSNYYVRTEIEPGEVVIKQSTSYPQNTERDYGGYSIIYTAGYGSTAADVPEAIKQALKMWVALIYENRVPIADPPDIVKSILSFYRILNI